VTLKEYDVTSPAERMFEGAVELGRIIAAQRAADRQATRDARNARRRRRYAATKHMRPAKAATVPPAPNGDSDYEPECRCHIVPMPPCSYCESGFAEEQ
jgi:hypothetical protein